MNTQVVNVFQRLILADHTVHVKLLGDSITHGVGGTGWVQNGEPIAAGFRRSPDSYCWAKLLKDHLEANYDCVVTNNACTGTSLEFIETHFDELVSEEDEIILCTIGTNNRHQYNKEAPLRTPSEQKKYVYEHILKLYAMFAAAGKGDCVVFVANIPASFENEKDGHDFTRIIHMNDIHDLYVKASVKCGFPLIRMYTLFMDYCEVRGITLDSLLADGLHPNDAGYAVMFKLLMDEIGLARKVPGAEF